MEDSLDVIIVGAGIAGLVAARELANAEKKVAVIEARDRIGGRLFTRRDLSSHAPIELGAEFVHGCPPEILSLLKELDIEPVESRGEAWCEQNERLTPCDLFSEVDDVLEKMNDEGPDESFLDFIGRCCPQIRPEVKERARRYITGFHAADPALISVHSLVRGLRADAEIDGERAFRIPGGYEVLIKFLEKHLSSAGIPVHLNTIVQEVNWQAEPAKLTCHTDEEHRTFSARQVLLTLPLGVLQAPATEPGAIRFTPELPAEKREALRYLEMGKVMRVTLSFQRRFWEDIRPGPSQSLANMSFLFSNKNWFPTWWTTAPMRLPIITGWAPFHCAEELSGKDVTVIFSSACQVLSELLQVPEQELENLAGSAAYHDWVTDPFSRGAYSYVKVGGDTAQANLGAPIDSRLFFAGEATDVSGHHGTVHGAIASAQRAVREILSSQPDI